MTFTQLLTPLVFGPKALPEGPDSTRAANTLQYEGFLQRANQQVCHCAFLFLKATKGEIADTIDDLLLYFDTVFSTNKQT